MNCLVNYPLTHLSVGLSFSLSVGLSVSLPIYRLLASLSSCLRLLTGRSVCLLADRLVAICLLADHCVSLSVFLLDSLSVPVSDGRSVCMSVV